MKDRISIREAITENDVEVFWGKLREYFVRDIFPGDDEDRAYFLGDEYAQAIGAIHSREEDKCLFLFFERKGKDIGFAMPVIYLSEDGKCFIMEFCVYPEFRGKGCGSECANELMDWCRERGALYFELNNGGNPRRERFWHKQGFINNGFDEWGEPLMLLLPKEKKPIDAL